jgi:hypothetical protein
VRGLIARFMRRAVQVTFNIDIPISVAHLFNGWVTRLGVQFKKTCICGSGNIILGIVDKQE